MFARGGVRCAQRYLRWLRVAAVVLAAGAAVALLACGGEDDEITFLTDTKVASPAPSPAGPVTLDRFHYAASLTLREQDPEGVVHDVRVATEGDFQRPDRHSFRYTIESGEDAFVREVKLIGDRAWVRQNDDEWREVARDDEELERLLVVAFSAIQPSFFGGPSFERLRDGLRTLPATEETVNEVLADHYEVDPTGEEFLRSFLAEEGFLRDVQDPTWDLWLARDGGWPVRMLVSGTVSSNLPILEELGLKGSTAWELEIDISRPNDPSLMVNAPEVLGE